MLSSEPQNTLMSLLFLNFYMLLLWLQLFKLFTADSGQFKVMDILFLLVMFYWYCQIQDFKDFLLVDIFDERCVNSDKDCIIVYFVLTALQVDGERVNPGMTCSAVCGSALSLVCIAENCSSHVLTAVTVQVLSVHLLPSCSASSEETNASDRRAVFDNNAVVVGCLKSAFPQVHLVNLLPCFLHCVTLLDISSHQ